MAVGCSPDQDEELGRRFEISARCEINRLELSHDDPLAMQQEALGTGADLDPFCRSRPTVPHAWLTPAALQGRMPQLLVARLSGRLLACVVPQLRTVLQLPIVEPDLQSVRPARRAQRVLRR